MSSVGSLSLRVENTKNVLTKCRHFRGSELRVLVTVEKSMIDFQSSNKSFRTLSLSQFYLLFLPKRHRRLSFAPNKYLSFKYQVKCHLLQEAFPKCLSPRYFSFLKERRVWIVQGSMPEVSRIFSDCQHTHVNNLTFPNSSIDELDANKE